jgi:hypothetical protein
MRDRESDVFWGCREQSWKLGVKDADACNILTYQAQLISHGRAENEEADKSHGEQDQARVAESLHAPF